jgi:hypothetical protein
MHINYKISVPGKVIVIDDVFDDFESIDVEAIFNKPRFRFFPFKWQHGMLRQYDLTQSEVDWIKPKLDEIRECIGGDILEANVRPMIGAHEMVGGEFIPPHADQDHFGGLTICLNKEWDAKWGGQQMAINEETGECTVTAFKPNRAMWIICPIPHMTAPVYAANEKRRSLQIFWKPKLDWERRLHPDKPRTYNMDEESTYEGDSDSAENDRYGITAKETKIIDNEDYTP